MKVMEMKLVGDINPKTKMPYATATICRHHNSEYITVTIHSPSPLADDLEHKAKADNSGDVFSMAEYLQFHLDGCHGTNSMVHEYYRILEYFMD